MSTLFAKSQFCKDIPFHLESLNFGVIHALGMDGTNANFSPSPLDFQTFRRACFSHDEFTSFVSKTSVFIVRNWR